MSNVDDIVLPERRNDVVTLWLNRPQPYNALSEEMLSVLKERLDLIASDSSIHCVILAAKGDAFCAGHDLREMQQNQNIVFLPELI